MIKHMAMGTITHQDAVIQCQFFFAQSGKPSSSARCSRCVASHSEIELRPCSLVDGKQWLREDEAALRGGSPKAVSCGTKQRVHSPFSCLITHHLGQVMDMGTLPRLPWATCHNRTGEALQRANRFALGFTVPSFGLFVRRTQRQLCLSQHLVHACCAANHFEIHVFVTFDRFQFPSRSTLLP